MSFRSKIGSDCSKSRTEKYQLFQYQPPNTKYKVIFLTDDPINVPAVATISDLAPRAGLQPRRWGIIVYTDYTEDKIYTLGKRTNWIISSDYHVTPYFGSVTLVQDDNDD